MGWHLSPALFWQLSNDNNIDVQSVFSCAPKTSCMVVWLPNFLGWVDLLTHGALLACARALLVHNFRKGVSYCLLSQLEMAIDASVIILKVHVYRCEFRLVLPEDSQKSGPVLPFWFHSFPSTETDIHQMRFFKDPDFNLTVFMDAEMNPGPPEIENSRSLLTLHLSPPNSPRCLCLYSRETLLSVLQPVPRFASYTKRSWYSPV